MKWGIVAAVICVSQVGYASMPQCLKWKEIDGGVTSGTGRYPLLEDGGEDADAGLGADGGTADSGAADAGTRSYYSGPRRECVQYGYPYEGGCSTGATLPVALAGLAALMAVVRRRRASTQGR